MGHRLAAHALLELSRPEEALRAAREALRLDAGDPTTFLTLARVYQGLEEHREAWSAAARAIALDPTGPDGHLALALAAGHLGRRETAERAYRRVLELDPSDVVALNNLGVGQINRGRVGAGARSLAAALAHDPGFSTARENIDALGSRWARQVYLAGLLALVAVAAALGLEELLDLDASGAPLRSVVAGTAFLALAGWVGWAWLDMPVPVRRVLRRRLVGRELRLSVVVVAIALSYAALLAFLPYDDAVASLDLIRPLGLVAFTIGCVQTARWLARDDVATLAAAQRAAALHPHDADAQAALGLAALRLRRHAVGDEANRRALAIDPGHVTALLTIAARHLGRWRLHAAAASLAPVRVLAPRSPRVRQSMDAFVVTALVLVHGVLLLGVLALCAVLTTELDPAAESTAPLRAAIGAGVVLALCGVARHIWRGAPQPLRLPLLGRLWRRPLMLLPATAVAGMLTTVAVLAWGQVDDPRMLLAGQSLVVPLTVALALMARRRVRRMAGRAREVELHP